MDISDYAPSVIQGKARASSSGRPTVVRTGYDSRPYVPLPTPARTQLSNMIDPATGRRYVNPTQAQINAANTGLVGNYRAYNAALRGGQAPGTRPPGGPGGGSGGGGGGGGGGAAPAPTMTQAQLDALIALMQGGGPKAGAALDLPDYQAFQPKAFDNSTWANLRNQLTGAVNTDVGTAEQGTQRLLGFLGQNYQNAYTNPNNTYATAGQAPGMDQNAMARMLQGQGVDPSMMAGEAAARAGADQAFGNVWRSGAANEDSAQRNRLGAAGMYGQDAVNRIRALGLGGQTGINMQEGQARSAYDQRVEQWAREDAAAQQQILQQEAQGNWQQGNEFNTQQQQYRNSSLQALLQLMPDLIAAGIAPPNAQQMGWG